MGPSSCRPALAIDATPDAERQEIRDIYAAKGFAGELLERVVDTITANREAWLATMMDEELHLQPVQALDIFHSAIVITIATLIGHLIPLLPFLWLSPRGQTAQWVAVRGQCEPAQPPSGARSLVRARTWNSAAMSRCS